MTIFHRWCHSRNYSPFESTFWNSGGIRQNTHTKTRCFVVSCPSFWPSAAQIDLKWNCKFVMSKVLQKSFAGTRNASWHRLAHQSMSGITFIQLKSLVLLKPPNCLLLIGMNDPFTFSLIVTYFALVIMVEFEKVQLFQLDCLILINPSEVMENNSRQLINSVPN